MNCGTGAIWFKTTDSPSSRVECCAELLDRLVDSDEETKSRKDDDFLVEATSLPLYESDEYEKDLWEEEDALEPAELAGFYPVYIGVEEASSNCEDYCYPQKDEENSLREDFLPQEDEDEEYEGCELCSYSRECNN